MARRPGEDLSTLGSTQLFGYGVDAGTGSFMDATVARQLEALFDADRFQAHYDALLAAMDPTYRPTRSWADYLVNPALGQNLVCFSSGWGDGLYPSFVGRDSSGEVTGVITDFFALPRPLG